MAVCTRCRASYDFWSATTRKFSHVCDRCATKEKQTQQQIREFGLPALTQRFVPNVAFSLVAVGVWDPGASLERASSKLAMSLLTGGISSGATFINGGFLGISADTIYLAALQTNLTANDRFYYASIDKCLSPSTYRATGSQPLATIATAKLGTVTATIEQESGVAVISLDGQIKRRVVFQEQCVAGNIDAANRITSAINAAQTVEGDDTLAKVYERLFRESALSTFLIPPQKSLPGFVRSLLGYFQNEISTRDWYFAPHIPSKKVTNARTKYATHISESDILAIVDGTVFGSAKTGCVLTANRLCHKASGTGWMVSLADISNITRQGSFGLKVSLHDGTTQEISAPTYVDEIRLFLDQIANHRRSEQMGLLGSSIATTPPAAVPTNAPAHNADPIDNEDKAAFSCPKCSKRFRTSKSHAGKRTKCPNCAATFHIPVLN